MRKLMFLVLTISGLSVGCGSSSDTDTTASPSTEADAGGNGGGAGNGSGGANGTANGSDNGGGSISVDEPTNGGEEPEMYPDCDGPTAVMVLGPAGQRWTGEAPWTMQQFQDCQAKCTDGTLQCFIDMCDGQQFVDCFTGEIGACAAENDAAPCYDAWEDLGCCAEANSCTTDQATFDACTGQGGACGGAVSAFSMCASRRCQTPAATRCVQTAGAGGGMMPAATPASIPADLLQKMVDSLN